MASWVLLLSLFALPGQGIAQTESASPLSLHAQSATRARLSAPLLNPIRLSFGLGESTLLRQRTPAGRPRDSLKNGIIIGAVVGALALGTFAGVVCKAQQEPEGPSCVPDTLRIAAVGAAIGVGAGLAIDAALTRNAGVRVSLGITF